MARHDAFSQSDKERIVEHVCNEIVEKRRSVYKVLAEDKGMCSYSRFSVWLRETETFAQQIARAREAAFEALIEEMIEIADGTGDHNEKRVRILAREKAAMMILPRRFGQKLDVTSGGEKIAASDAPARLDRIEALLALAADRAKRGALSSPVIDVSPEPSLDDVMS